jgi:carbon-monoxide dehydrogenase large subunit
MTPWVGQRVQRVEDPKYLRGEGRYIDDVELPGLLHGAFVRSPFAHARIGAIDASEALALPGIVAVVTGADLATRIAPVVTDAKVPEVRVGARRALPVEKVRFMGEAVALVVAESRHLAEDGCDAVAIEWEELEPIADVAAGVEPGAPLLDESLGTNLVGHATFATDDGVDDAFAAADRVFSKRFCGGRVTPMPLETRGVVASWERGTDELTVWSATQVPFTLRTILAEHLLTPFRHIRVIAPDVGGGFGSKGHLAMEELIVPAVARMLGRPLKWIADRGEDLAANSHSKEMTIDVSLAVDADGRFLAVEGRFTSDAGAYSIFPYSGMIDPIAAARAMPSMYAIPRARFTAEAVLTNKCPTGSYRGVGRTTGQTAVETLIDDVARGLDVDPVELRLRNAIPGTKPYTSATGMPYDGGSYVESLQRARELVGYDELRAEQARARAEGRHLGIGFSPFVEQTAWGSAMSRATGMNMSFFDSAQVTIEPTGAITVRTGQLNHGQGHETTFAQLVADGFGVPLEQVRIVQGDTDSAAYGMGTFASRGAVIGGGTALRAVRDVRAKLLDVASRAMEAWVDDLELVDGRVQVKGSPADGMTIAEIAHLAHFGQERIANGTDPALTATRSYDPPPTFSNGTIVAVAEVDVETGIVRLDRIVAVEDCGVMLNPMVVDGQVAGGIAQGIGVALYERVVYGDANQFQSSTLADYLVPSAMEVPPFAIEHLETPSPLTEGGIKGVGEAGTQAAPAAVANAVADALAPFRAVVTSTPLDPETVLGLIEAGDR